MGKRPLTLKGFRDFLPAEMAVRQRAKKIITQVFRIFGFAPLATPALEYQSVLLGKYGPEADKLVYTFKDKGGRPVGLRYDLTVPLARVAAEYQTNLTTPFKRYQIQPVWRADKPQQGRWREFEQCDFDILNSSSPLADAEIISVINACLQALGMKQFVIKLNSRQILFDLIKKIKLPAKLKPAIIQTLDKLDKNSLPAIKAFLKEKGLADSQIKTLFQNLNSSKPDEYLSQVIVAVKALGVPAKRLQFDPSLARGLDYYTGPIFEAVVTQPRVGSLAGGGRYDNLIKNLGGPDWPAVGASLGLDRICEVIYRKNLWPETKLVQTQVLVTFFPGVKSEKSIQTTKKLRRAQIDTELYLEPKDKLEKQLKYANKKNIPFVIIIGPNEAKQNCLRLKNMSSGEQKNLSLTAAIAALQER
jgi:histidyl-tRNA synthetase